MQIERIRPALFQVTLHAYELATLVAAARLVAQAPENAPDGLTEEARQQLSAVLADYDEAFRKANAT